MLASFPGRGLAWEWGYSSPICSVNCTLLSVFLLTKVRLFTLRILCSFKQLPLVVESEEDLNEVRQDAVYQSWNFSRPELSDSLLVWAVLNFTAFCFTCSEDGTVAETSILKTCLHAEEIPAVLQSVSAWCSDYATWNTDQQFIFFLSLVSREVTVAGETQVSATQI